MSTLRLSPYWNLIDLRLIEKVTAIFDEATVQELLGKYKDKLYPLKLVDLLSFIPAVRKDDESHYKIMSVKIQKNITNVSVKDFFSIVIFLKYKYYI